MNIVFMGTPDFAVPCLDSLVKAEHRICAVFTQPDKPKGRKMVLTPPPVKERALELNIPVYQPISLKDGNTINVLSNINPDIIIVVAYGKFLPKGILELPRYGCVNVHASLLPRHRGASPIQWAIVSGDKTTGVTTMLMNEGMDTGDILDTLSIDILPDETADSLHDRLSLIGAELICKTVKDLENGIIKPIPQDEKNSTYAPIINKEMGRLDFSKTSQQLCNLIRGFVPWPTAYTILSGKRLKIYKAKASDCTKEAPGTVLEGKDNLLIACGNNSTLELLEVQLEGSRRMTAAELLRGHTIEVGTILK